MHTVTIRTRSLVWFAAGIAVALIAATVFVGVRSQAADDDESSFVPITPCRLFDTRPTSQVGPRDTPLGADETYTQQVTGTIGDCSIPDDATAIALNVTATDATAASFLTIWPDDQAQPLASSLNYLPAQAPTPNKVDVQLGATGAINLFNKNGTVHVLADATGYYTPTALDDLQQQITDLHEQVVVLGDALDQQSTELEQQATRMDRDHVFTARVYTNGDKLSTGNHTTERVGTGTYYVIFDVEDYQIPDTTEYTYVTGALGSNRTVAASVTAQSSSDGTYYESVKATVYVWDSAGASADGSFSLMLAFDDPTPFIALPV